MNFLKTSFYTSISTVVTFICGFIVAKVVAVKIGPGGIALVGQFQNTMAILTMLGSGAINMGVVKYLSEKNDRQHQQKIITNSLSLVVACSLPTSLVIIFGSVWFSNLAFHVSDYWIVYLLFGVCLLFVTINSVFISIFNGLKEIKWLTVSNIIFSITGIIYTVLFAFYFGVKGVLVAINATAITVFISNYILFKKIPGVSFKISFKLWDKKILKQLFAFSMMSAMGSFVLPAVQLIVRNKIISNFSINEAGYWQGVTKISDYYLTFITTVLSVYYLPRLSEITDKKELRKEIFNGYKIILPVAGTLALLIGVFRHYIILILFSKDFLPMQPLFTFQLIGDVIKIASWLLGFLMWAKAMVRPFIITEIIFSSTFVLLSVLFINRFGVIGTTYAFAVNYFMYFVTMAVIMWKKIF